MSFSWKIANRLCCDSLGTNHFASAWQSVRRGGPRLEEQRSRLFYRVEQPAVAGPTCERPDLVLVASRNPFEIAESVRQLGDPGRGREGQHDKQGHSTDSVGVFFWGRYTGTQHMSSRWMSSASLDGASDCHVCLSLHNVWQVKKNW